MLTKDLMTRNKNPDFKERLNFFQKKLEKI